MAAKQVPVPISQNNVKYIHWIKTPTKTISEVHWNSSTSQVQFGSATYNQALAIYNLRRLTLPANCLMLKWQISQENIWRDAVGSYDNAFTGSGNLPDTENLGNDALNVLFFATAQYRRVAYLAAIPDANITRDGWVPGAANPYFTRISAYLDALAGGPIGGPPAFPLPPPQTVWGDLPIAYGADGVPAVPIVSIAFTAGSPLFNVVTAVAHGLTAGQVVRISKFPLANANFPVNQRFLVNNIVNGTTAQLQATTAFSATTTLTANGGMIQQQYRIFSPYSYYSIDQPGSRKRGSTQLTSKGRNKVKYNIGFPG